MAKARHSLPTATPMRDSMRKENVRGMEYTVSLTVKDMRENGFRTSSTVRVRITS